MNATITVGVRSVVGLFVASSVASHGLPRTCSSADDTAPSAHATSGVRRRACRSRRGSGLACLACACEKVAIAVRSRRFVGRCRAIEAWSGPSFQIEEWREHVEPLPDVDAEVLGRFVIAHADEATIASPALLDAPDPVATTCAEIWRLGRPVPLDLTTDELGRDRHFGRFRRPSVGPDGRCISDH